MCNVCNQLGWNVSVCNVCNQWVGMLLCAMYVISGLECFCVQCM